MDESGEVMLSTHAANINQLWANVIVEELSRHGISQFVLSPGSRCSPLTVAAANHKGIEILSHFDERAAAFYALGYARATGRPAVLICTSGTATANYYPAVIEASMDMIPMLLLTADRPEELRDTGANQTIDQVELYRKYTRFFHDLLAPDLNMPPDTVLEVVTNAVAAAMSSPSGPAHINCQFREPLAPVGDVGDFSEYLSSLGTCLNGAEPYRTLEPAKQDISDKQITDIVSKINSAKSGLIVVGGLTGNNDIEPVKQLTAEIGWPVFAEIRSGLRLGSTCDNVVHYFDQLLLSNKTNQFKPEVVLHFGSVMTSKRFNEYIAHVQCPDYIHIANHPFRHDPAGVVTEKIETDIIAFSRKLLPKAQTSGFANHMTKDSRGIGDIVDTFLSEKLDLSEIAVARLVSKHIEKDSGLFLGNSMPVRDMDMYADPSGSPVTVIANRGASGIDGGIATAIGFANGLKRPVTAVMGDLAFLHDLNSLALLPGSQHPVTLIVINNNGGGIFSFLPIHECQEVFEKYFGTPHGLSLAKFAEAFELNHVTPDNTDSLLKAYKQAQQSDHSSIIEIVTDRETNRTVHLALQEKIQKAISAGSDQ